MKIYNNKNKCTRIGRIDDNELQKQHSPMLQSKRLYVVKSNDCLGFRVEGKGKTRNILIK